MHEFELFSLRVNISVAEGEKSVFDFCAKNLLISVLILQRSSRHEFEEKKIDFKRKD